MKQVILALAFALTALLVPASVLAQTTNLEPGVCVSVYGGGVVCGAKHEVVPTALGDFNPGIMGAGLVITSGFLVYLSRKVKRSSSQIIG